MVPSPDRPSNPPDIDPENFGCEAFRAWMDRLGLTFDEVATLFDRSVRQVKYWAGCGGAKAPDRLVAYACIGFEFRKHPVSVSLSVKSKRKSANTLMEKPS